MDWLTTSVQSAFEIVASSVCILAAVVLVIRLNGLRSFSKMSSFDFAVTVAIGSIVASTVLSDSVSVLDGAIGASSLLAVQRIIAWARSSIGAGAIVDNTPVVLMVGDRLLDTALARTRVTRDDVMAKLREANVIDLREVHAVVLESTGDVSVLHGTGTNALDARLLEGVIGAEAVPVDP